MACLAVFLHEPSGPSAIWIFPPHSWSAPDGLPLLLRKQPIWAAGNTPNRCRFKQGLPWHPGATGSDPPPPCLIQNVTPFSVCLWVGWGGGGGLSTPSLILTKYL